MTLQLLALLRGHRVPAERELRDPGRRHDKHSTTPLKGCNVSPVVPHWMTSAADRPLRGSRRRVVFRGPSVLPGGARTLFGTAAVYADLQWTNAQPVVAEMKAAAAAYIGPTIHAVVIAIFTLLSLPGLFGESIDGEEVVDIFGGFALLVVTIWTSVVSSLEHVHASKRRSSTQLSGRTIGRDPRICCRQPGATCAGFTSSWAKARSRSCPRLNVIA